MAKHNLGIFAAYEAKSQTHIPGVPTVFLGSGFGDGYLLNVVFEIGPV